MLSLIDVATTLGENEYALSLGQCGMGFYLWDGKPLCANNVYLHLSNPQHVKAFTFSLMTEYNDVRNMTMTFDPESSFNFRGFVAHRQKSVGDLIRSETGGGGWSRFAAFTHNFLPQLYLETR